MKIARVALVVPALLLVVACGSSDDPADQSLDTPSDSGAVPGSAPRPAQDAGSDGSKTGSSPEIADDGFVGAPANETPESPTRAVISKGQITLHNDDVDQARFEVQKLLDTWGGEIANEESDADEDGQTARARLELRIPGSRFDDAMDELPELGTLVDRSRAAEDVTTQVIDTNSRVRSQKLSLARVQALLAKASDLNQVIAIETQLSQRQADLDSLLAQQKYLADQTSMATINLYLSVPDEDSTGPKEEDDFLSGLSSGWDALGSATNAVLVGVGAVLPFAATLGLVAFPVWLVVRRRRTTRTAPVEA